jgi:hypothetical protein
VVRGRRRGAEFQFLDDSLGDVTSISRASPRVSLGWKRRKDGELVGFKPFHIGKVGAIQDHQVPAKGCGTLETGHAVRKTAGGGNRGLAGQVLVNVLNWQFHLGTILAVLHIERVGELGLASAGRRGCLPRPWLRDHYETAGDGNNCPVLVLDLELDVLSPSEVGHIQLHLGAGKELLPRLINVSCTRLGHPDR